MKSLKTEIKLNNSQYKILSQESKKLHLSVDELLNRYIQQYIQEITLFKTSKTTDYMSIVALGESGNSDISQNHDKYLGEILANEHIH